MLTNIAVSNFKPFRTKQDARLAPLTFVYGPNSAGKSSIIQSILLLKQSNSGVSGQLNLNSPLNPYGPPFNFGSIRALIHRQKAGRSFGIGLTSFAESDEDEYFFGPDSSDAGSEGLARVGIEMTFRTADDESDSRHWIEDVTFNFQGDEGAYGHIAFRQILNKEYDPQGREVYRSPSGAFRLRPESAAFFRERLLQEYPELLGEPEVQNYMGASNAIERELKIAEFYSGPMGFPDFIDISDRIRRRSRGLSQKRITSETSYRGQTFLFWSNVQSYINQQLAEITDFYRKRLDALLFIGPLRSPEERGGRFREQDRASDVGSDGAKASAVFSQSGQDKQKKINNWFKALGLNLRIDVSTRSQLGVGDLDYMTLKTRDNDPVVRTTLDVGFGIPQVLPVIVQGVVSEEKTLLVEQPEIHLHPRLQSGLADFFIDSMEHNANQWIIESHSELFIRRIQTRIRQGRLLPDQVCVLYVDPVSAQESKVMELRLDEDGEFIDEWPSGFFDEGFEEIAASYSMTSRWPTGRMVPTPEISGVEE